MTDGRLDPRVRSLLDEALDDRGLQMQTAQRMLEKTQRLEGEELEQALRELLAED